MNQRIKKFNHNYFNEIDTSEKAYILGVLYSDGALFKSKNGSYITYIGQIEENKDIIYKIKDVMNANVTVYKTKTNNKEFYYTRYISKQLYTDLHK